MDIKDRVRGTYPQPEIDVAGCDDRTESTPDENGAKRKLSLLHGRMRIDRKRVIRVDRVQSTSELVSLVFGLIHRSHLHDHAHPSLLIPRRRPGPMVFLLW